MTWLDIGNGWRNLFLLSCLVQMGALGTLFAVNGWFSKRSRLACFLTGMAVTPLVQYLWTLLLAIVWPAASRWAYIGILPLFSAAYLAVLGLKNIRRAKELFARGWQFARRCLRFDKPALIAACFVICLVLLVGPACVRFLSSMECVKGGDAGEYMALGLDFCENRELSTLLEKEELEGHFRGHSHFPSLELYMSYGLFHTGGEMGYPHDKAAFTGLGMLIFYALMAYAALLLHFCREKKITVLLGILLFNLVPVLYTSVEGAPRDIWRILALLTAANAFAGFEEGGNWKAYIGKLLFSFGLCFTVMSTHVVCFVVLPFIVIAWVLWRWLHASLTLYRGGLKALVRAAGIALSGAAGTLLGFSGNLWCYLRWGQMSPWRLMTTYTDAPWYSMYMDIEYKLEETTTHLNFWQAKDSILMGYATPIGVWGFWLAVAAMAGVIAYLIFARVQMKHRVQSLVREAEDGPIGVIVTNRSHSAQTASLLGLCALTTLMTLAPMTGILDSPLYSFSGSFLKMTRYTLQWFMMGNVMICASLTALIDHWPAGCFRAAWMKQLPVYLCALLCVLSMVKGTNQTGYTNTFYRLSRGVMESESILLDNGFRSRYALLMDVAEEVEDEQKILITRVGYQYPLRGRGYVLTTNPIVPLMNLTAEEIGPALEEMNAAMLATEPAFWDERYYKLSALETYFDSLPDDQIIETETMRLYLFDRSLIPAAQAAVEAQLP